MQHIDNVGISQSEYRNTVLHGFIRILLRFKVHHLENVFYYHPIAILLQQIFSIILIAVTYLTP